ncbi:HAD-IIIA family hydrolase [Candidatus Lucifugimonas marina]|uniref:HAD-IIIA family hydrolase n=1 Tax=Candidatus Lucifugimonas marina TaxID=3038979 RepID=A0AAJ5ZKY3_9CHLR|nr:HAD-IIIA family hydrolase [SAR202 cluster bacterium JH702]MDG0870304.1 HAD-IIIA family hydrolase [SAR202 cluster bacterium JH639]WFG36137.1 HAD-IIIA family hydrolase [SAR202 cluster bacterium JH545]WFG40083.1 HAD-IIIA family hydrolase [SAR202 cluster bacterium JH1073]
MPVTLRSGEPKLPEAIAFDCYDTLFLNSHDGWKSSFQDIIDAQNVPLDKDEFWTRWRKYEVNFRKIRTDLGRPYNSPPFKSYRQAWTECFQQVFDDIEFDGDANLAGDRAALHMTDRPIFPETVEALNMLKGRVKLGVFSNADDEGVRPLLDNAGLEFDFVGSSQSAQVYKPALAAFEYLYKGLDTEPSKIWYVGDKLLDDVLGGYRSGATTVWINRNEEPVDREPEPDIEITDLRELSGILEHIGG